MLLSRVNAAVAGMLVALILELLARRSESSFDIPDISSGNAPPNVMKLSVLDNFIVRHHIK